DNAREGFQAQADSAIRAADGETLTLTGKVQLCWWLAGQRVTLAADQVVVNLRTARVQSCAGGIAKGTKYPTTIPSENDPIKRRPAPYTVAPPDVLSITVGNMAPKAPYRIEPQELLKVQITSAEEEHILAGEFTVTPEGSIDLGPGYGTILI